MRTAILAAASAAAALTLALFDSTPAEAAKSRHVVVRKAQPRALVRQSVKPQTLRHAKKHHSPKLERKIISKTPLVGTGSAAAFAKKSGPQLKFKGLPITPAIASTSLRAGRL